MKPRRKKEKQERKTEGRAAESQRDSLKNRHPLPGLGLHPRYESRCWKPTTQQGSGLGFAAPEEERRGSWTGELSSEIPGCTTKQGEGEDLKPGKAREVGSSGVGGSKGPNQSLLSHSLRCSFTYSAKLSAYAHCQ